MGKVLGVALVLVSVFFMAIGVLAQDDIDSQVVGQGREALFNIAVSDYKSGDEEIKKASVHLFLKSAEQGYAPAQLFLGYFYVSGEIVEKNEGKAVYWYTRAAMQGSAEAQFKLGVLYQSGNGIDVDVSKAVYLYEKSAKQGFAMAQFALGACYEEGYGIDVDMSKAVYWYEKAAEQGIAGAQLLLGVCYEEGEGVDADMSKAVYWYRKASEQGLAEAQYWLAVCYYNGAGVSVDKQQYVYWLTSAAKKGNLNAIYELGKCYYSGEVVVQNKQYASYWFDKAVANGVDIEPEIKKHLNSSTDSQINMLLGLADLCFVDNRLDLTLDYDLKALDKIEMSIGKNNDFYAYVLSLIASRYCDMNDYRRALEYMNRAVDVLRSIPNPNINEYLTAIRNRCIINMQVNNEDISDDFAELVSLFEKLDRNNTDYANLLSTAAVNRCMVVGDFNTAKQLCEKSLHIFEESSAANSSEYMNALIKCASVYMGMNETETAIKFVSEALDVYDRTLFSYDSYTIGKSLYSSAMQVLAGCYLNMKDFSKAALMINSALKNKEIYKYNYISLLIDVTAIEYVNGNYSTAINYGKEVLPLIEQYYGKNQIYVLVLSIISDCYCLSKDYSSSLKCSKEAISLLESTDDYSKTAVYLNALQILSMTLTGGGWFWEDLAGDMTVKATKEISEFVLNGFRNLTGNERRALYESYKFWFEDQMLYSTWKLHTKEVVAAAYDGVLLSKGILLNSDIEMSRLLLESGDTAVVRIYEEMRTNRSIANRQRENLFRLEGDAKEEMVEFIDSLARMADRQERELVARSKTFGDYTRNLAINWQDVRDRLGEGDIAVEFLEIPTVDGRVVYAAMTLKQGYDAPHFTVLFGKETLDGLDKNFYFASPALYNMVWQPLAGELEGVENVYFAPAGELHRIAIEYAPVSGNEIFSDRYNAFRLTSTRQLAVSGNVRGGDGCSAALYGGLRYDASPSAIASDGRKYSKAATVRSLDYIVPAVAADSLIARGSITELPATKAEIDSIEAIMGVRNLDVESFSGILGTEASFKALSGQRKNIIHVATHGFYGKSAPEDYKAMMMPALPVNRDRYVEDKAMTRSGLLFAGAANAWQMPDTIDNGILTAQEVAALDLRGLDLCVLSACETGLGEITGEGVFGLQRGFKKAGAGTLLVSLRPVYDEATSLLMTEFYRNYLSGKSKTESLRAAQRYLRDYEVAVGGDSRYGNGSFKDRILKTRTSVANNRKVRPYSDPKYWAYFVLVDAL